MKFFSVHRSGVSIPENLQPITHVVIKNTFYNLVTQGALLLIAFWSLPIIVRSLSKEGFGLLSLVWAIIGYFTLLDFGISRANTKFLSEALVVDDKLYIRKLIWTSLFITGGIGIITGVILSLGAPFFVSEVLKIDAHLVNDATFALIIASFGLPFMLVFGSLKGFQMALQRFDIVNVFQGIMGFVQWGGSVVLLWFGFGIKEIIILTVGIRILLAIVAFAIFKRLVPHLFDTVHIWDRETIKDIFKYGGWLSVSLVVSPLFLYLDRLLIGIFLSLTAVAYYTVPQEAISRLLIVPLSLTATLFPALSRKSVLPAEINNARLMYLSSLKYLFFFMLPIVVLFIVYAFDILTVWIGNEFAMKGVLTFQILSIGFLFNSLAQIPTTALHAFNRPDITAKFHLLELPIMILLNIILIPWIGIIGAAIAWSVRVIIDACLLFIAANRISGKSIMWRNMLIHHKRAPYYVFITILPLFFVQLVPHSFPKLVITIICILLYGISVWFYGLDERDRSIVVRVYTKFFR